MQNNCLKKLTKHLILVLVASPWLYTTCPMSNPFLLPRECTLSQQLTWEKRSIRVSSCRVTFLKVISFHAQLVAIPGAQPDYERTGSNSPPSGRMLSSAVYRTGICLFRKVSADMEKECLEHSSEKTCSEKERLIGGKPDYHQEKRFI